MISRSETVLRLIKIKKTLYTQSENQKIAIPQLKGQLDQLIEDIIGVSDKWKHQINNIINKVIEGEIEAETAIVAIHEIVMDDQGIGNINIEDIKKDNNKNNNDDNADTDYSDMEEFYQRGYS